MKCLAPRQSSPNFDPRHHRKEAPLRSLPIRLRPRNPKTHQCVQPLPQPPLIYPAIMVKTGVLGLSLPEATHPAAGNPRSFRPLPDQRLRSPVPLGSLSRSNRHLLQCERSRSAIEPTGTRLLLGPGIQLRSIENNESYYRLEFRGTH